MPKKTETPVSSIVRIIIKNAEEEAKKIVKEKSDDESNDDTSVISAKDEKSQSIGGYGTISRNYGAAPQKSYVDYDKIFSYLGKFRARNAYENFEAPTRESNGFLESSSRTLVDLDTMDRGARHVRYFIPPGADLNQVSLVPVAGLSSSEWEQFKLWMKVDPVMYLLKSTSS